MQDDQNNQNQTNQKPDEGVLVPTDDTQQPAGQPDQEGQHQHDPTQSPAVSGEEDVSGSAPSPTSDDDTGKMVEEVVGEEPKPGETIADIVNNAEAERTRPPEPTEEESPPTGGEQT